MDLQQSSLSSQVRIGALTDLCTVHFMYGNSRFVVLLLKWIVRQANLSEVVLRVENGLLSVRQDQQLGYAEGQVLLVGPERESPHLPF